MIRRIIDSDNSCLFNSIGLCMLESKKNPDALRKIVKEAIKSNPNDFEFMLDRSVNEYLEWITKSTSWGGGIELLILSKFFAVEICIINVETLNHVIYGQDGNFMKRIYLLYSGIHYDAITRNIYEDMEEETDERVFDIDDNYAFEGSLFLASELRKKRQYTNLKDFALICDV
jgi:ubiquitin thioesterase OTU1